MNRRLKSNSIPCECGHNKTSHIPYRYKKEPTTYGQCHACYKRFEKLSYDKKCELAALAHKKGLSLNGGIASYGGCDKYKTDNLRYLEVRAK